MSAPPSFDRDLMTEWGLWVLEHDLPALPEEVGPGESVPVARWVGATAGGVLHVRLVGGGSWGELQVFLRGDEGWEIAGQGGAERAGPLFGPPDFPARTAELYSELSCTRRDGSHVRAVDGAALADGAVLVEIQRGDELERHRIESSTGAVVAAWVQPADDRRTTIVRVVDDEHRTLTTASFAALSAP